MNENLAYFRQMMLSCRSVMETARADYDQSSFAHRVMSRRIIEITQAIARIDAIEDGTTA